jgi:hypothetical protein
MTNEFNILFENLISEFDPALVPVPGAELEISIEPNEELTELEIGEKVIKELKGLRKIARDNGFDGKIYYRARNIEKLIDKLITMHGGQAESTDEEAED